MQGWRGSIDSEPARPHLLWPYNRPEPDSGSWDAPRHRATCRRLCSTSSDDRCWIGRADHIGDRSMPVPDQPLQLGFCAIGLVVRALGFIRSAPPGGAATTDWNQADPNSQAKRLRQQRAGRIIANAAPALIAPTHAARELPGKTRKPFQHRPTAMDHIKGARSRLQ